MWMSVWWKKCNSDQWWNKNTCWWVSKTSCMWKYYIWNPATCRCKNGKYLASIMDDPEVMCDEFINAEAKSNNEETKTVPTNFNEKYNFVKHKISIFYLPFY